MWANCITGDSRNKLQLSILEGLEIFDFVAIKYHNLKYILSLLTFASCGQVVNKPADNNIDNNISEIKLIAFELTVEDADYSMSNTLIYELTKKN
jgi:hypothetical protein